MTLRAASPESRPTKKATCLSRQLRTSTPPSATARLAHVYERAESSRSLSPEYARPFYTVAAQRGAQLAVHPGDRKKTKLAARRWPLSLGPVPARCFFCSAGRLKNTGAGPRAHSGRVERSIHVNGVAERVSSLSPWTLGGGPVFRHGQARDRRFSKGKTSLVPAASIIPSGFVHGRPSCARDLDLCVFNHDYPIEKVQAVVDRYYNHMYDLYHTLYKTPPHEVQWVENYTLAFAAEKQHGSFVCRSEAVYLRIGWAKNWKGLWMTVVNTERFPQVTRVEKCKYRNKPCDYMVPCYKSSCKQREMLFPLIAVNPYDPGQKPLIDLFPIPSGCVCYVDDYRFH
ncbi:hypothetical protein HPB51_017191 [Rhipicephalus microplus]|uniref:Spaetzle domain-containing protein n=1 Tax=Rhipicephalus microplus TaxID=6941 RepID=A0A9J6EA60_RHIMP|nr:hypothetical protein HPB51_017191 [Rhipicephalus microplus]